MVGAKAPFTVARCRWRETYMVTPFSTPLLPFKVMVYSINLNPNTLWATERIRENKRIAHALFEVHESLDYVESRQRRR